MRGWQNQDTVYLIMWQSKKSGGTYTELRKTEEGKNRFLATLAYWGVDMTEVVITEQKKVWKPSPKKKGKGMMYLDNRKTTAISEVH